MGTRGVMGFVINGEEKLTYNHFDSYPSGLGVATLKFLRGLRSGHASDNLVELNGAVVNEPNVWDGLRRQAKALKVVSGARKPTAKQIEQLRPFLNLTVDKRSEDEWYNLLRETQGDWAATLKAGYMIDNAHFALDSLYCEWGYVIDLDAEVLEVYEGFQKWVPKAGRWAGRPTAEEDAEFHKKHLKHAKKEGREPWRPLVSDYKAIELKATFPLNDLPSDAAFVAQLDSEEETVTV